MTLFSERYSYVDPRNMLQVESMDHQLRIGIYNVLYIFMGEYESGSGFEGICKRIWVVFWHKAIDEFPRGYWNFYPILKQWICSCAWYEPYDLIESLALWAQAEDVEMYDMRNGWYPNEQESMLNEFTHMVNTVLEREASGYRMIGTEVAPIINDFELSSLGEAVCISDQFAGSRHHIAKAIELLSEKPKADYPNAVKEAISAAEAAVRVVSGDSKAEMGKALDIIKEKGDMHGALIAGWRKLYGFTSDEGGIRHAADSCEVVVDFAMAKYMVVSCSAFVNYLVQEFGQTDASVAG